MPRVGIQCLNLYIDIKFLFEKLEAFTIFGLLLVVEVMCIFKCGGEVFSLGPMFCNDVYELGDFLGSGLYEVTYSTTNKVINEKCACIVVSKHRIVSQVQFNKRVRHEINILNPSIVQLNICT